MRQLNIFDAGDEMLYDRLVTYLLLQLFYADHTPTPHEVYEVEQRAYEVVKRRRARVVGFFCLLGGK